MPQSIIIQVGQAGNQIGARFWEMALNEQIINNENGEYDESMSTYFRNTSENGASLNSGKISKLRARGLLIDMEEGVIGRIKGSSLAELFESHQYITSNSGSGNNWGQGYYHYGEIYRDDILESLNKEAETCDSLQSIVTIQSTGGGTGSGLGSFISEIIRDEFPQIWRFSTAIVPSQVDDVVTSPYNSLLSIWKLSKTADCILPIDNDSLYEIYRMISGSRKKSSSLIDNLGQNRSDSFNSMNNIVSNLLLNMTR